MDRKIQNLLSSWLKNNVISQDVYDEIQKFETNSKLSQKSKAAKAITLIGSLFLISGLLGTIPFLWENLAYWAQLLLLAIITSFLHYSATYSERFENKNFYLFKSSENVSSVLYFIGSISLTAVFVFLMNYLNTFSLLNITEELSFTAVSFFVSIYTVLIYNKTKLPLQHIAIFASLIVFTGSLGNLVFSNIENWAVGLFLMSYSFIWGLNTFSRILKPSWLGYLLSSIIFSVGLVVFIEDLISNNFLSIFILIISSIFFVWISIQLSEQSIFYVGGLGLVINLPRLITALLPDSVWPPLVLLLVGAVLVVAGLYLNSLRENLKNVEKSY